MWSGGVGTRGTLAVPSVHDDVPLANGADRVAGYAADGRTRSRRSLFGAKGWTGAELARASGYDAGQVNYREAPSM